VEALEGVLAGRSGCGVHAVKIYDSLQGLEAFISYLGECVRSYYVGRTSSADEECFTVVLLTNQGDYDAS
jgi:hypothetical protein